MKRDAQSPRTPPRKPSRREFLAATGTVAAASAVAGTAATRVHAAEDHTIRLALIKVPARVTETRTRIKVALPTCYPHQSNWALLAGRAAKLPP